MSYAALSLVVTGDFIPASWGNQTKANFDASAVGVVTTAGDMVYATGSHALARLGIGTGGAILTTNAVATAPAWSTAWKESSGHLLAQTDNTYDVGASGATRPRRIYVADAISVGTNPAAQTGDAINLPSQGTIFARNHANTADMRILSTDVNDHIQFGSSGGSNPVAIDFGVRFTSGVYSWSFAGSNLYTMSNVAFAPNNDNTISLGTGSQHFSDVYCTRGAFNGSSRNLKRDIDALAPRDALAVVLNTEVVRYRYIPMGEDDANADRWHVGFIAEDAPDLLCDDHRHVTPQTTASVALAAIQELHRRLAALEGAR